MPACTQTDIAEKRIKENIVSGSIVSDGSKGASDSTDHSSSTKVSGEGLDLCLPKKEFSCDMCEKMFTRKYGMMRFRKKHTQVTSVKGQKREAKSKNGDFLFIPSTDS
jgi:hypothetical protein